MQATAKSAQIDKVKNEMMKMMNITDPAEFQRIARDYCKEMAVEMCLPPYLRAFSKINKIIEGTKENFDSKSREEKVGYVLKIAMDDEETVEIFKQTFQEEDTDVKDAVVEMSGQKRAEGNTAFQKKKDDIALRLYTEAVMSGRVETEEGRKDVALGLANRSAVLVKMGQYGDCLEDIEAALYFGYPDNIRYKLMERQAKCFKAQGQVSSALTSYNRLILVLKQSSLDKDKIQQWKLDTTKEIEKLRGQVDQTKEFPERNPQHISSFNSRVPQFSDAVEIVYSKHMGRHGKATRTIEAGEVIMQDTCVTSHLLCRNRKTHCTNCMKKMKETRGIPSPIGVGSKFCGLVCLKAAMDSYHPVEGKINLEKFFWNKKDNCFQETSGNILLAYRAITQKPLDFFLATAEFDVNPRFGVDFTEEKDQCLYSDYGNLFNLEGHRSNKSKDETLSLSIRSAIFIVLLRYGGYFGEKQTPFGGTMSKEETILSRVVYHFQEGIQYNLHSVDEVVKSKLSGIASPQLSEVGCGVFPSLLLLNHSCEPNTVRISANGNQVLMFAKRRIKAGDEISDNYGIHHLSMTFEERQEALNRGFNFSCCCEACAKDYPRMKSLRSQLPEAIEDKFEALRDDVKEQFRRGNHQGCLSLSISMLKLLESNHIVYPHRSYELAGLSLHSCIWTLHGNKN